MKNENTYNKNNRSKGGREKETDGTWQLLKLFITVPFKLVEFLNLITLHKICNHLCTYVYHLPMDQSVKFYQ